MKKIALISSLLFLIFSNSIAQNCFYSVDTTTKYLNCGDSTQLFSSFLNKSIFQYSGPLLYKTEYFYFFNDSVGLACGGDGNGSGGIVFKTTDAGINWQLLADSLPGYLRSVDFISDSVGFGVCWEDIILKTTDSGNTWFEISSGIYSGLTDICFLGDSIGIIVGSNGVILKTIDAGANWLSISSSATNNFNSLFFTNSTTGFAVGDNGIIFKTQDAGDTWGPLNSGTLSWLHSVYFTDTSTGYAVGENSTIIKTTNAGNTWIPLTCNCSDYGFWSVRFINDSIGYVSGDSLYFTSDAGNSWVPISFGSPSGYYYSVYPINYDNLVLTNIFSIITLGKNDAVFNWSPSVGLSNPNVASPKVYANSDITYYVTITPNIVSGCGVYSDSVKITLTNHSSPSLCMVSVDSASNKNIIVWENEINVPIDSIFVYKESNTTGIFNKIGAVYYYDQSVFIDTSSYPLINSSKYKISLLDSCGLESNKSLEHKTMHLAINQGVGNIWNLIWEPYEGFTVSSYNIFRGTSPDSLLQIGSVSASSTQYSDYSAPTGNVYYQIQIINPTPCNPSKSFEMSLSNIATNDISYGIQSIYNLKQIKVYPNPVANELILEIKGNSGKVNFDILNAIGQVVFKGCLVNKTTVQTSNFAPGVYLIKLENGKSFEFKKVIKE
ncbi:MAG TPA: YCF48-related protein [Bacteroidales bacterium]|nr:YCF48-related protein [Bacteroidales bacterium]